MAENNSPNLTSVGWPNSKDEYVLAEVIGEYIHCYSRNFWGLMVLMVDIVASKFQL